MSGSRVHANMLYLRYSTELGFGLMRVSESMIQYIERNIRTSLFMSPPLIF